jgi:DNA-binding response OmpR family regulator
VWGFDREIEENTLDVFMLLLRNRVDCSGKSLSIRFGALAA